MSAAYRKITETVSIREASRPLFRELQCAVLDCDGTLVNINHSYNACIKKTAGFILERLVGGKQWYDLVTDEMILRFRMSGGFNNDTDTSYACILSVVAWGAGSVEDARKFVLEAASHATDEGIVSVEEYLSGSGRASAVQKTKAELAYPGSVGSSILSTVFDEFFYGRDLFARLHGIEPRFNNSLGFIEEDEVVITGESASELSKMFGGRVAIVSGRGRLATEYALKSLLHHFMIGACVFLEDEEREAVRKKLDKRISKPEPYALFKSMEAMNARSAVSVGDSAEDVIMSRRAGEKYRIVFCGVYGTGIDREKQFRMFVEMKADAIIENVNQLPFLLRTLGRR